MNYNYSKLRGKIIEVFTTLGEFSKAMGWSERTNGLKLNGKVEWKQGEIITASRLLGINPEDIDIYFFDLGVQGIERKQIKKGGIIDGKYFL